MQSIFKNPLTQLAEYNDMERDLSLGHGPIQVSGLPDSGKAHIISELAKDVRQWKLVITYDETRARELFEDLRCFMDSVYLYPAKDLLFFSADIQGHLIAKERIDVWRHVVSDDYGCVVTTADALMDKLPSPDKFAKSVIKIKDNETIDLAELSKKLIAFGYDRTQEVDGIGQFALRGGIIDIYPLTDEFPVRIELWDDEIDSIRTFDTESQRSIEKKTEVSIYPAQQEEVGGQDSFLRYFDIKKSAIFIDEPLRVKEKCKAVEEEFHSSMMGRFETGQILKEEIPELFSSAMVMEELKSGIVVCLTGLDQKISESGIKKSYSLIAKNESSYHNAFDMLIEDLKKFKIEKYRVVLLTASRTRASRLASNLREYGLSAYCQDNDAKEAEVKPGEILVIYGNLHRGFEYPLIKFKVISESDIFGAQRQKKKYKKKSQYEGNKISSLAELSTGDFVVHEDHGLGIYRGIDKIERDGVTKDYIKIEYRGGDNCYLPATRLDVVQKYATADSKAPKLNKLGGPDWDKTKSRVKKAVAEIARDLVKLYAARLDGKGFVYGPDTVWQQEFEEMFPFDETEDQINAIEDTKRDMESPKIMDRLICGDVGYGKTEIALRTAFKVIQEGRQVIYLVPTTILAQQHYNTFTQRMKDFPVRVELLCRFRSAAEQKKALEDFKKGLVDIIIGTHRVLSKDIVPKRLGLLVIDEEQRFGVTHKEKLKKLKQDVDVLTLTATPIPRTLHMSLVGIRDLSVLEEPPMDRQPIQTYVMEYHDETVKEAIRREVARGGQVYYVYNRVNNIAEITAHLQSLLPDASMSYAHGQMNERKLESIMLDFINGDIDVLVSTTIIETGLDIPNVNTIIIQDADRLGLSQLYQLRGRVGRSSRTAYAFLFYKKDKLLSEEAEKRLKAIKEFTELGSGIKIAMRDLEIRGAGNVLGAEQHGHMQSVGYDLYCKMLNKAVKLIRGDKREEIEYDTSVDIDADAYIPSTYISNEEQKLDIYKRIASIETQEDYLDIQDELLDRFGEMNKPVDNLLMVARIRSIAHMIYITEIIINKQEARITMLSKAEIDIGKVPELVAEYAGRLIIRPGEEVIFILTEKIKQYTCEIMLDNTLELIERMREVLFASKNSKNLDN